MGPRTVIELKDLRIGTPFQRADIGKAVLFQVATIPYVVAGVLFVLGDASAPYWLAGAVILSTLKAATDAWVLLVEINR